MPLRALIWPLTLRAFLTKRWQRRPFFVAGNPGRLAPIRRMLPTHDVAALLERGRVRTVAAWYRDRSGALRSMEVQPTTALRLFEAGMTLYFHLEETHSGIRAWRDRIAQDLAVPDNGRISVFASRQGVRTPHHFDGNHNFTVQLAGTKRWRVASSPHVASPADNWVPGNVPSPQLARYSRGVFPKRIPRSARRLEMRPGSVLYVPPGCIHETVATSDSISLNIALRPPSWADRICSALRARLMEDPRLRASAVGRRFRHEIPQASIDDWAERAARSVPIRQ